MGLIVNLSTIHDYSINETVSAFVRLCNQYSYGCLQCMPGFFQTGTNYAWVMAQYKLKYKSLIEPYKLGNISTEDFLDNLAEIFYFMDDMSTGERNKLLKEAWNASIKMSEHTQDRLRQLVEKAASEKVYLISNTNELNIQAILDLFKEQYPDLPFKEKIDISIQDNKEPVEILPNIYLCLSYRFKTFKSENVTTVSLVEELVKENQDEEFTVVSQYAGDLKKAEQLGIIHIQKAEEFYFSEATDLLVRNSQ
ncbi:Uncharacterised protein [Legionella lansingensis]|uniref:Uncharacterized protein n=1 Tax=Legionella lansingensis TaxID=45067 RepID=A0A0W0VRI2_9GAMM|nr:hypothetical protein [Legionella lansingensis]KTD22294.1 hypothetical protein Llan_1235 [Legionella lansingensis]SNV50672.1 Uncharacterised protein [Legionella lansingensis]